MPTAELAPVITPPWIDPPRAEILTGDCCEHLKALAPESVDLAFCDPPFNIGYEYDIYQDKLSYDNYMNWVSDWGTLVRAALKPTGSFWLCIGDEFAADLKVFFCRKLYFKLRSWVIWYFTFGNHQEHKFTRSHYHFFHFTITDDFHFDPSLIRVPSARQLLYNDKRANGAGRVPDDTWILHPQWADEALFDGSSDTWYAPRIAGTHKERIKGIPNQLPEAILRRIITACTRPGDLVIDPTAGSGTTIAVAKKLARRGIGMELSPRVADIARARVDSAPWGCWA